MNELSMPKQASSIITVIGVGGAGGNAVNHMWNTGIKGVNFLICNTDQKAMDNSPVKDKIRLGQDGLGLEEDAGANDNTHNHADRREQAVFTFQFVIHCIAASLKLSKVAVIIVKIIEKINGKHLI